MVKKIPDPEPKVSAKSKPDSDPKFFSTHNNEKKMHKLWPFGIPSALYVLKKQAPRKVE